MILELLLGSVFAQVPAYNEPPELLALTIEQLMLQEYPGRFRG